MFKRSIAITILFVFTITGCATSEKSILLGSSIGIGIGAGLGTAAASNQSDGRPDRGALIGALIGGVAGGLIGYGSYKDKTKKGQPPGFDANSTQHFDISGNATNSANRPTLKPAQVRVQYVEDQVKDGTFIPAHFEYLISEPAHWEGSK